MGCGHHVNFDFSNLTLKGLKAQVNYLHYFDGNGKRLGMDKSN
jgi:hypothetical protein